MQFLRLAWWRRSHGGRPGGWSGQQSDVVSWKSNGRQVCPIVVRSISQIYSFFVGSLLSCGVTNQCIQYAFSSGYGLPMCEKHGQIVFDFDLINNVMERCNKLSIARASPWSRTLYVCTCFTFVVCRIFHYIVWCKKKGKRCLCDAHIDKYVSCNFIVRPIRRQTFRHFLRSPPQPLVLRKNSNNNHLINFTRVLIRLSISHWTQNLLKTVVSMQSTKWKKQKILSIPHQNHDKNATRKKSINKSTLKPLPFRWRWRLWRLNAPKRTQSPSTASDSVFCVSFDILRHIIKTYSSNSYTIVGSFVRTTRDTTSHSSQLRNSHSNAPQYVYIVCIDENYSFDDLLLMILMGSRRCVMDLLHPILFFFWFLYVLLIDVLCSLLLSPSRHRRGDQWKIRARKGSDVFYLDNPSGRGRRRRWSRRRRKKKQKYIEFLLRRFKTTNRLVSNSNNDST